MFKYLLMALITVCLVIIAVFTLAGFFWLTGAPGLHPAYALVGIIAAALIGGAASVGIDSGERRHLGWNRT